MTAYTPRQLEILAILAEDPTLGYKQIAARMTNPPSVETVRNMVQVMAGPAGTGSPLRAVAIVAVRRQGFAA